MGPIYPRFAESAKNAINWVDYDSRIIWALLTLLGRHLVAAHWFCGSISKCAGEGNAGDEGVIMIACTIDADRETVLDKVVHSIL